MEKQSVRVRFKPDQREVWVAAGSTLKEALFAAAIPLSMPCGGHGRCGRCLVIVDGKVSKAGAEERSKLPGRPSGARLACMARAEGDVTVTIPRASRVTIQKIAATGKTSGSYRFRPGVRKVFVAKPGARSMRVLREDYGIGAEDLAIGMTNLDLADEPLRSDPQWHLGLRTDATALVARHEIVGFEEGDTRSACFGVAVDVGTNTVVCSLVDLATGRELASASSINPQVTHGDDVISRIRFSKTAGGLELLHAEIVNLINALVGEMTRRLGIDRRSIYLVSAVGNTAMQHILVGVSPADLGRAPYRARIVSPMETLASRTGLECNARCRLLLPPIIGGFVGGDLVALVVSQSLHRRSRPVLAADLGTNGEIVIAANGMIAACSTAAGPAFEGERISAGVRAIQGAIEDVRVARGQVKVLTIGRARAVGLCGSGLLAAIAELLRAGVIESSGRIRMPGELRSRSLAARVVDGEGGRQFVLSRRPPVLLRQGDVREVQLGKAAICAGIKTLASAAGVALDQICEVLIAGSFGSALRASSIRRIGLLPEGLRARVRVIGNSAIEGAKIFLTSDDARAQAAEIAVRAQHLELFARPEFKEEFYASMRFPPR